MANPGIGNKFVSVNLNKSYGQQPHPSHHGSSFGSNRVRPGSHGGGGGMVVLSRPRSSQKVGPKLSVPPPLNLPSLRKEHERFDSSGSGSGAIGGGGSGGGSRPNSSGMGWTKPGSIAIQEKVGSGETQLDSMDQGLHSIDEANKGNNVYIPPLARPGVVGLPGSASVQAYPPVEKAMVLRGEDFPSLRATLSTNSGLAQKQKDGLNSKQKHILGDEASNEQRDGSPFSSMVHMRPQVQSPHHSFVSGSGENRTGVYGLGSSHAPEQARMKGDYFPGPLPLVRLNPRSDWADDERDTGHGITDRGRDYSTQKSEGYWDREFDMPRGSLLSQKPVHNVFDKWGKRDDDSGKTSSAEVFRVDSFGKDARTPSREGREGNLWKSSDPYGRDVRTPSRDSREGNSWRSSFSTKNVINAQEVANNRNGVGPRSSSVNRETINESKFISSPVPDNAQDDITGGVSGNRESPYGKRDLGHGQGGRQHWNNTVEQFSSRGVERNTRDRYSGEQYNRYRGDTLQNSLGSKSSFPINDSAFNSVREKRSFVKSEKPYVEDPFLKDFGGTGFDGRDPFTGAPVGVVKRKKDVLKQTDFHDPVRESFEAELERVQKMQEQERQRIIEEQERAMELAQREEEERERLAREEEERQRRLEEEAREAAWRAEQERVDSIRRTEEQKIAREEEKRRILMEEERRKQAANQKLIELEERMSRRHAEAARGDSFSATVADHKMPGTGTEKELPRIPEMGDWEDGERMVERITTSASSDSSSLSRSFEVGSRPYSYRDVSAFPDRGKPFNSWRRDAFENDNSSIFFHQDHDNGHDSPSQDASTVGRAFSRKDNYGGPGFMSPRNQYKGGAPELPMDEFTHLKGQRRWNFPGDEDRYGRNAEIDLELHENLSEKFGDIGWGQGRPRGNPSYPERLYHNPEVDGVYSFGRSRFAMRQPRVLPPPSVAASVHKPSCGGENDRPGPSSFLQGEMHYNNVARSESPVHRGYDGGYQENLEQSELIDVKHDKAETEEQKMNSNPTVRCDSQSSLSVSSPPSSPTHLSHDDLDESGNSPVLSTAEGKNISLSGNESASTSKAGKGDIISASSSVSTGDDEEWTVENNERLQEQEEYDEVEDGYQEEDEVHEGDDDHIDLTQEFEDMHLGEESSAHTRDNLILGFNEGVKVEMPSVGFEKSPMNEEGAFAMPQVSYRTVEEQGPFDGLHSDGQFFQPVDSSPQVTIGSSSSRMQETEKTMHDLVVQPTDSSHTLVKNDILHCVAASTSSLPSTQNSVPSSANTVLHSSSGQTVMSTGPTVPCQSEVPVKLQFGLFSGPSLIPSPVPAIQIGSIQMPLHLHPQVGPSLSHMHPSQPPIFQFGQFRYTSPISQGILPLGPPSMSFVQPNFPAQFPVNQNLGGPLPISAGQDTSQSLVRNAEGGTPVRQGQSDYNDVSESNTRSEVDFQADGGRKPGTVSKNYVSLSNSREREGQPQTGATLAPPVSRERVITGSKAPGPVSGGKGRKFVFAAKNSGSRLPFVAPEDSRLESTGFQRRHRHNIQRTEFRVRENADRRQSSGLILSNDTGINKSNFNERGTEISVRNGSKRGSVLNRPSNQTLEPESFRSGPLQDIDFGSRPEKGTEKEASTMSQNISRSGEGNLKRNIEEDIDAPLQSGIVRVYEQPGIEAPSDEDDFIEVRSKRQMLNDRREQREKEIKAKSRLTKTPRKHRSAAQSTMVVSSSNKISASPRGELANRIRSDFVISKGRSLANAKVSAAFNTTVSQPLAPIGTPAVNNEAQADIRSQTIKSLQTSSLPVIAGGEKILGPGLISETNSKVLDNVQNPLGSWGNARIDQQVMALTQNQLDEAMNPARFDTRVASLGDRTSIVREPSITSTSILAKDKQFVSASSPVNSLLAGEKIQFGAVTSPTILPPSSRSISHGIGPPGSCRPDVQISHKLSAAESGCSLFYEKEKHANESFAHLENSEAEAEAEAAASALAVAAISSDEIVACSVSVSDAKSFGGADINVIAAGVNSGQQIASQSRAEESLSVALPADLSVETPPISLWPPSQSPQNSVSQLFPPFHAGPAPHFPYYDMNPMLGGPVYAFGPHDESGATQSQTQKGSASVSGTLGTWPQSHSSVDSFYGPPAGFTGPFISPPGGIPGVQGPPHMVVYNHFAPVGQFGQVGLSFMGTTYIPSGKQPDWKHNPTSSAMGIGEGDMSNMNVVSAQRNPPNMPAPMQHLAPGSPLLPMAPVAVFDVSPFQSSPDMSVPTRWSHVSASPLQSVPLSLPLQQHPEGVLPQFSHGSPMDQPLAVNSLTANMFPESRSSTPSDSSRSFAVASEVTGTQFPDELGLVDPSNSSNCGASTQTIVSKISSGGVITDGCKTDATSNGGTSSNSGSQAVSYGFKNQSPQQKNLSAQQQSYSSGYNYQRGGISQKNNTGVEWSHRRPGFQARNHSLGAEKSFHSSKMKQIYVAKQTTSGMPTSS